MCQLLSCKGKIYGLRFSQRIFLIPLLCVTPSDSVTLRVDILPPQNQPVIRTAGFLKVGKQHMKLRMCLMLSRSPSGVEGQAELLYAEGILCHPLKAAPDSGVRARSLRPAVLPLTEVCGCNFVSEDLPRQNHREIISETPKFSPLTNIFSNWS